jgi:hypothetical protein
MAGCPEGPFLAKIGIKQAQLISSNNTFCLSCMNRKVYTAILSECSGEKSFRKQLEDHFAHFITKKNSSRFCNQKTAFDKIIVYR